MIKLQIKERAKKLESKKFSTVPFSALRFTEKIVECIEESKRVDKATRFFDKYRYNFGIDKMKLV